MGIKLIEKQKLKRKNEKKNEKSELAPPTNNNPNNELQAIFDPPTEILAHCFLEGKRSFIEDRRWAGLRASELVEKKYGGYNEVTNEQLSQSFKQAWKERITFCKAMKTRVNKTPVEDTGNSEPKNSGEQV